MSSYTYQPLDPSSNTVRLLRLSPGQRNYDDRVRGALFEIQLPDERDDTYEALSYTWGDPTRTKTITINGQTVAVATNLYDALFHLRDPVKYRILWVDALCINQQDAFERTHQVSKMSFIYQRAWAVLIWLGRTTPSIELLLEATKSLDEKLQQRPRPSNNAEHLGVWIAEGRRFMSERKTVNPEFYEIRRQALKELLSRSWFRRVWVVQEAASAKLAHVQCSWASVPSRTFCIMPYVLEIDMDVRSQALLEVLPGPLRQSSWWNDTRDLSTVLQKFSKCESTDPRDQIFALLGLSTDVAKDGQCFLPNYELDTLQCIQQTIFFLAFGEISTSEDSLPTWDLEEFRHKLPCLRLSLLEWGIGRNDLDGIPIVRKLLHEAPRFDVNQQIFSNRSPLSYLVSNNKSIDMIQIFLERDDLDVRHANEGLCLAASLNRIDVIHAVLGRNNAGMLHDVQSLVAALECAIEFKTDDATKVLCSAVRHRKSDFSQVHQGLLLIKAVKFGNTQAITMLVEIGIHPDIPIPHDEGTAMLAAVDYRQTEALKLLPRLGADMNKRGVFETPASGAAKNGSLEIVTILLDMGATIPATIVADCIYWWLQSGRRPATALEMVELLVTKGADIDAQSSDNYNGLLRSAEYGDSPMVKLLIRLGANLEVKFRKGETALDLAVGYGHVEAMNLLISAMARLKEEGSQGLPALWAAVLLGETKVVRVLGKLRANFTMSEEIFSLLPDYVFEKSDERRELEEYLQSLGVDLVRLKQQPKKKKAGKQECRPVKRKKVNHT